MDAPTPEAIRFAAARLSGSSPVRDRFHLLVADAGTLADTLDGLARLLDEKMPGAGGAEGLALVRLAKAAAADAQATYRSLDALWCELDEPEATTAA